MGIILKIGLGLVVLIVTHAMFLAIHGLGWYPDEQLAKLILASPTYWHVEWVRGCLTAVFATLLWLAAYYYFFLRNSRMKHVEPIDLAPSPVSAAGVLRLSVGEDHSYNSITKTGLYMLTRQYQIRLDNASQDQSVTHCKVVITDIQPQSGCRLPRLLKEGFSLAAGDHAFIPLASYGEARQPAVSDYADTMIIMAGSSRETPLQYEEPNVLTIRATALGAPFTELKCYLWVDSQGKFRASTSSPSKDKIVRKIDRDVWLADAIWRAYLGKWERPDHDLNGPGVGEESAQRLHDIVVNEIRQFAFEGKLPIWGKRRGSSLWEPVPKEFWKDNRVNYLTIIHDDPTKILVEGTERFARNDEWQELMTSWQRVEYLWPQEDIDE